MLSIQCWQCGLQAGAPGDRPVSLPLNPSLPDRFQACNHHKYFSSLFLEFSLVLVLVLVVSFRSWIQLDVSAYCYQSKSLNRIWIKELSADDVFPFILGFILQFVVLRRKHIMSFIFSRTLERAGRTLSLATPVNIVSYRCNYDSNSCLADHFYICYYRLPFLFAFCSHACYTQ